MDQAVTPSALKKKGAKPGGRAQGSKKGQVAARAPCGWFPPSNGALACSGTATRPRAALLQAVSRARGGPVAGAAAPTALPAAYLLRRPCRRAEWMQTIPRDMP